MQRRNAQLGFGNSADESGSGQPSFKIKSKAIILLTDGVNNGEDTDPMQAAQLAKEWGIKVYTIGIGSDQAFITMNTMFGSVRVPVRDGLDEGLLKAIAETTGGFYSRADDAESLRAVVKRINELEKTEVKSVQYTQYAEHFARWTTPALILLLLEMLAGCTVFRKIP